MTPDRLRELRRIAEAATPGKRVVVIPESRRGHEWLILQVDGSVSSVIAAINKSARNMRTVDYCAADAEFFAAFDPPTVLAMLDEIERLRREREKIVDSETRFELYDPDLNAWECQACRFWWEFEVGDPYEHDMRFCPWCGRRIVR